MGSNKENYIISFSKRSEKRKGKKTKRKFPPFFYERQLFSQCLHQKEKHTCSDYIFNLLYLQNLVKHLLSSFYLFAQPSLFCHFFVYFHFELVLHYSLRLSIVKFIMSRGERRRVISVFMVVARIVLSLLLFAAFYKQILFRIVSR